MRDDFDITLERKLESNAGGAGRGIGVRRIELITGAERRRRWSEEDKARIVVESFAPAPSVGGGAPQRAFSAAVVRLAP